jgi:hypothetical protein
MRIASILLALVLSAPALAQDAAPPPAAAPTAARPAAPVMLSRNARRAAVQLCMAEAQRRWAEEGATEIRLDEVEDTDALSDDRVWVRLEIGLRLPRDGGGTRKLERTVKCKTQSGAVTDFEWS